MGRRARRPPDRPPLDAARTGRLSHVRTAPVRARATEARRAVLTQNRTTETHCSDFGSTRTCESY